MKILSLAFGLLLLCEALNAALVADYIIVGSGPGALGAALGIQLGASFAGSPAPTFLFLEEGEQPVPDSMDPFPRMYFRKYDSSADTNTFYTERAASSLGKRHSIVTPKGFGGGLQLGTYFDVPEATQFSSLGGEWSTNPFFPSVYSSFLNTFTYLAGKAKNAGLTADFLATVESLGYSEADFFGADTFGAGAPYFSGAAGYNLFLGPALYGQLSNPSPPTVVTGAKVTKILVDSYSGLVATGVEYIQNGVKKTAYCNKEVIVSAGTFGSPKLLELSGIGDAAILTGMGIDVVLDLPSVGENLILQPEFPIVHATAALYPEQIVTTMFDPNAFDPIADFFSYHSFSAEVRDPVFTMRHSTALPPFMYPEQSAMTTCTVTNSVSRGSTHISSQSPSTPPTVISGIYSDVGFSDLTSAGICFGGARFFHTQQPLASGAVAEVLPGPLVPQGDSNAMSYYIMSQTQPGWATSGTCSIGTVLSTELLVNGFDNLRVIDNSAYPNPITGSPSANALFLGLGAGLFVGQADYTVDIDLTRGHTVTNYAHGYQIVETPSTGDSTVCADIGANPVSVSGATCVSDDIANIIGSSFNFWVAPQGGNCRNFEFAPEPCSTLLPVLCRAKGQQA